ncbi:MAG: glycosyltransferase family 9 protein [Limisphaerales bacterium]
MNIAPQSKFLIVSLRYIGDVLLSTPLALSIKQHFPEAQVDYLVFKGTEGILAKNPYVRKVHVLTSGTGSPMTFFNVLRRYDFAIGVNPSDRTAIYAGAAAKNSIGFSYFLGQDWWKKHLLSECRLYDDDKHIVPLVLSQLEPLGIPLERRVIIRFDAEDAHFARQHLGENYVLLHPYTRQSYKYWPAESWARFAELVETKAGMKAIFTRSGSAHDEAQFATIEQAAGKPLRSFSRPFTLTQLAAAIRGSAGYIGVDTVATHMAAALDVPMIALFGPTFVHNWGPWPNGWQDDHPYQRTGRIQQHGRITVVQQAWPCVPCGLQACPISKRNKIECMESLSPRAVYMEFESRVLGANKPQQLLPLS